MRLLQHFQAKHSDTVYIGADIVAFWQCGETLIPGGRLNLHKACQEKQAGSALRVPGRRMQRSGISQLLWRGFLV